MTSEAPERIWAWRDDFYFYGWVEANDHGDKRYTAHTAREYIPTDHAHALVAEAYENAANTWELWDKSRYRYDQPESGFRDCGANIRALTPADALAARDARDRQVRKDALREAKAHGADGREGAKAISEGLSHIEELEARIKTAEEGATTAYLFGTYDERKKREAAEAEVERLREAGDALSFAAQTTGGTAGRDDGLVTAIEGWTEARAALRNGEGE